MLVLAAKCTTEAELHDLGWLLEHEGGVAVVFRNVENMELKVGMSLKIHRAIKFYAYYCYIFIQKVLLLSKTFYSRITRIFQMKDEIFSSPCRKIIIVLVAYTLRTTNLQPK